MANSIVAAPPTLAESLIASLKGKLPALRGKRVGLVLSGGNIDLARYAELLTAR